MVEYRQQCAVVAHAVDYQDERGTQTGMIQPYVTQSFDITQILQFAYCVVVFFVSSM